MESKKQSTCSCFSFWRRNRSAASQKSSSAAKVISKHEAESELVAHSLENDFSINPSLSYTQKPVGSSIHFRSSIRTPSRRTVQMHNMLPSNLPHSKCNAVKPDQNHSLDISHSQPAQIKEISSNHALSLINAKKNGLSLTEKFKGTEEGKFEEGEGVKAMSTQANCGMKESLYAKLEESKWQGIKEVLARECCDNPYYVESPFGLSSGMLSNSSKFGLSPTIDSLEISPIKCTLVVDDYSDILNLLRNPEKWQKIPDVFIRSYKQPGHLPMLKPATPCYFTKRRVLPTIRQENKSLLSN